jgi:hypothetical protein
MNIQGLIERYEKFKASKKKMTSVDLVLKDLRSLDEPESLPFKLKDVVGRIRGFDPITQAIWLNKILEELGSDYGLMKYRSGYEQGKIEGAWCGNQLKDSDKIRRELNQVKVPQFIADKIEYCKQTDGYSLFHAMDYCYNFNDCEDWLESNEEKFARAWLDGYEVEEEKRYYIRLKNVDENYNYLNYIKHLNAWVLAEIKTDKKFRTTHTRKELEDANFGWVFDCPGIEIEEVE